MAPLTRPLRQSPELQLLFGTSRPPTLVEAIGSPMLEACSAASLRFGGPTLKSLGVTSTIRGEGRSTIAIAMAVVQRRDYGRKVLLLDMDFDKPSLTRQLGPGAWPGLSELLRGEATREQVIHSSTDGIGVVTVGVPTRRGPSTGIELLRSSVLSELAGECDVLIGDLPPLMESKFGHALAGAFEQVLVVVRAGVTPVARIREATSALGSEPVVVLNGVRSPLPRWIRQFTGS
jgi:Mrp family chromosome partitioning ATPase